ncbi:hypothetical protein CDD83_10968 [Cordyceps sp. RAO-2017]|nr:hypothetical protein CDD83_10968 [Cordyceps sp. RAO-2017]
MTPTEMLPPVDDEVLRDNPDFAKLYTTLTTAILNPDGSTRHDPAAEDRAAMREELDKRRLLAAQQHLLERAIATASLSDPKPPLRTPPGEARPGRRELPGAAELPEALLDLLLVLPPLLDTTCALPLESVEMLLSSPPLSEFESLLPDLAALASANLHSSALSLVRLMHPTTNASYLHRHIPSLPKDYSDLLASVSATRQTVLTARLRTLASLTQLLQSYTQSLSHLVRCLEAKHGVVARSVELRAEDVSLRAQRTDTDAANVVHTITKELYSPQAMAALRCYADHLRDAKQRTAEQVSSLQAQLDEYGMDAAGEGTGDPAMREMAKAYRDVSRQIDEVTQDLKRLEGR